MFTKSLRALSLLFALSMPSFAHADDGNLIVNYDCNAMQNRLIVKTYVTEKPFWKLGHNEIPFTSLVHLGMPLECPFETGDEILVKSYYGNGEADTGAYQHDMIIVNSRVIDKLLDFNPGRTGTYRITAPSAALKKHPRHVRDPLEDFAGRLPPNYINFDGMSENDRHKLLIDIRNRQH